MINSTIFRASKYDSIHIVILFLSLFAFQNTFAKMPTKPGRPINYNATEIIEDETYQVPSYIKVSIEPQKPILIAGRSDSLRLEIRLDKTKTFQGSKFHWNQSAQIPTIIWVSVPKTSGITFINKDEPHKSGHQLFIKFNNPDLGESTVISTYINYSVDSKVQAKSYTFLVDVMAELVTDNGQNFQDAGIEGIKFSVDTPLHTKLLMLLVVGVAITLFIAEWVRVDVVAIVMMILLPELGLLNAGDAFRGLSSNAVIAIIGVMIISYGLNRTGLVNRVIQPLLKIVRKGESKLVIIFSSMIAVISSVMQNTGAAVLFLPAIRLVATQELKIHISRVLMPIGMAAILGGTLTMIGTSPLILLNDILPKGMEKFGFMELTPIGLGLVIGGIAYLSTFGMRYLRELSTSQVIKEDSSSKVERGMAAYYPEISGPYEIVVPFSFKYSDLPQEIVKIRRQFLVNVVAVSEQTGDPVIAPDPITTIHPGMALCVYGQEKHVEDFIDKYGLILNDEPLIFNNSVFNSSYSGLAEMIISPRSSFIGKCIKDIRFRETFDVNALALHQEGKIYYRELADRLLNSGDAVLIHGTWEQIQALKESHQNFIIISPSDMEIHKPAKAKFALASFSLALVLMILSSFYFQKMAYNPIPLSLCLMAGAVGMILTGVISISEAYRAIDWRTVFLLGGLIPLGIAVDHTGTAQWLASGIIHGLGSLMSPLLLLIVLALLSCAFTMVVSNVGACALLVPLGISMATQIGIDPRVAAITVGIGVSNSFILPTHQVNALYMGPGEYRSKDYVKIGSGLSLLYIVILVTFVYVFYL